MTKRKQISINKRKLIKSIKQEIQEIEREKKVVESARDRLWDLIEEADALFGRYDEAIASLENAAESLSEHLK